MPCHCYGWAKGYGWARAAQLRKFEVTEEEKEEDEMRLPEDEKPITKADSKNLFEGLKTFIKTKQKEASAEVKN